MAGFVIIRAVRKSQ